LTDRAKQGQTAIKNSEEPNELNAPRRAKRISETHTKSGVYYNSFIAF